MDVEKFLGKAEAALRRRDVPQAIALYRQVLLASPDHGAARAGLLLAFRRKAELKGGPSLLDKAAARSLRAAAAGLAAARQPAALVKTCEAGLERDPSDPALLASLAEGLATAGRPREALAVWRHRLEQDARDIAAWKAVGRLHEALREVPEAIDALQKAHALDPHDPEVERRRKHLAAEGTLATTRFQSAASSAELRRDRPVPGAPAGGPRLSRTAGELADEVAGLSARVAADPGDGALRAELGVALLRHGDAEAALATVDEGLSLSPGDERLSALREQAALAVNAAAARAAQQAGDEQALAGLAAERARLELAAARRKLEAAPGDVAARVELGRACYRAGETEAAIEHFQAVMADPRAELAARRGLGACFLRQGMLPLARRQLEAALALAGGPGGDRGREICYDLGLVCERLGDKPGALARFLDVYEVDIHFKDVARKVRELS